MRDIKIIAKLDTDKAGSIFLATTALEEFWDTSMPIVFLGEWCQRFSRRLFWESLDGQLMASPWSEVDKAIQAADYINELYERLLPVLSDVMNDLHGVNHSVRYWRILLGPWLQLYLPVVYDRFICLQAALKIYPELTTKVLDEESWITPVDTLEFIQYIREDSYNLQIYSRLLKQMCKAFPSQKLSLSFKPFCQPGNLKSELRSNVFAFVRVATNMIAGLQKNKTIFTHTPYFSRPITAKLFLKSHFTVLPLLGSLKIPKTTIVKSLRHKILTSSWPTNDFEHLLSNLINFDIPSIFVEEFKATNDLIVEKYPNKAHAIFSATSWYYDEAFKQWSASSAEKGTRLLGVQHGGNYGSSFIHPSEDHEVAITDKYFSWGWMGNDSRNVAVFPMPATKLIGRKPVGADNGNKGILYVATSFPRYLFQFPNAPVFFKEYLEWQIRFVNKVSRHINSYLRVRLHQADQGWDIAERWDIYCPQVAREGWETPFAASMLDCRLYVSDNLQTTFIEGLALNKPGILFWNPLHNPLRPEAEQYYDQLRAVGILHDSPESAAKALNEIYADVENWWNEPHRQSARRNFCDQFARTSSKAVEEWVTELKQVVSSNTPCAQDEKPLDV